ANPARAVFIALAQAVPEELHLHAAVFVSVDFVAAGTDDHRRLRSLHEGLARAACGRERLLSVDRGEPAFAAVGLRTVEGFVIGELDLITRARDEILRVLVRARMPRQLDERARAHAAAVGARLDAMPVDGGIVGRAAFDAPFVRARLR